MAENNNHRRHMGVAELAAFVIENLNRRKGRVALTAIGVIIGTAAVVVLVSLATGLQRNATENLYGIGDLTQIQVMPGYNEGPIGPGSGVISIEGGPGGPGSQPNIVAITPDTLEMFRSMPGVQAVIPRDWLNGPTILKVGRMENWAGAIGIGTSDLTELGLEAQMGVTTLSRGTAVIGANVLQGFYDPNVRPGQMPPEPPTAEDVIDQQIKMTAIRWTEDGEIRRDFAIRVVGVLAETRGEADWSMYIPLEDAEALNQWYTGVRVNRAKDGYQQVVVKAEDPSVVLELTDAIKEMGYQAYASAETVQGINSFFTIMQVIFGGVGAIALLVAAIGIANTMAMAVLERTREIGLMKAVGATNRDVLSVFLGEASGIGLLGGIGGVVLGWSAGQVINVLALAYLAGQAAEQGGPPPSTAVVTPLWLPIFALVFATLIGLLSGLYPALRAATLIPVDALKYE